MESRRSSSVVDQGAGRLDVHALFATSGMCKCSTAYGSSPAGPKPPSQGVRETVFLAHTRMLRQKGKPQRWPVPCGCRGVLRHLDHIIVQLVHRRINPLLGRDSERTEAD